jgi:hypothetical protein
MVCLKPNLILLKVKKSHPSCSDLLYTISLEPTEEICKTHTGLKAVLTLEAIVLKI